MKTLLPILARDNRAASAAEFALVLPLLLLFLLGMLDVGRLMWTLNRAEKATQMGVRYAVVANMVPTALQDYSFAISGNIPQGDLIPSTSFGGVTCTSNSGAADCDCNTSTCGPGTLINDQDEADNRFSNIVDRMRLFMPEIQEDNVQLDYSFSGLGYAGDPNGSDVAPLVRVSFRDDNPIIFQPITLILFNTSITLPSFSAALTLEDGSGTYSN